MIHIEHIELLLPAFSGELLSCAAEVVYTTNHCLEVKALVWSEDLISSKCVFCLRPAVFV